MEQWGRRVSQFAAARGIPLGLAEYAVGNTWDIIQSGRWLRSVTDWAFARAAIGAPLRWGCYFSCDEGGDYRLTQPEHLAAYTDCWHLLENRSPMR